LPPPRKLPRRTEFDRLVVVVVFETRAGNGAGFFSTQDGRRQLRRGPSARTNPMPEQYLPVLFQVIIAVGFAMVVLGASVVFGRSGRTNATKDSAYECGMLPVGEGAPRFSVKFYMVAMLFVLFDIEVVFMYPWALQFRDLISGGNATALSSMAGFAGVLVVAYVYALKKGALNWKS
jgi:NADH-quinone oxidoreductase subunit A